MSGCRRLLAIVGATILALLTAQAAAAHPLGNFTINHYSRLVFADGAVRVLYVLDFAEIPTFQQMKRLDTDGDGALSPAEADAYLDADLPGLIDGLHLTVGGRQVPLAVLDRSAAFAPGQGGLPTLRLEARLGAALPPDWQSRGAAGYADRNFPERLGWREIVVQGGNGVAITNASVPAADVSQELRTYPEDRLASPLGVSAATFTLAPGAAPSGGEAAPRQAAGRAAAGSSRATNRVVALVTAERLTPTAVAAALLLALFWGAAHALSPGHGKAVVAAYLVGARGTARHAAYLGLTVTLTHTIGVFALGGVTLSLSRYLLPETLYPWLSVTSGLLVVAIALVLLRQRLRGLVRPVAAGDHDHPHDHGHGHHHHHDHDHAHDHAIVHTHDGHTHSHLPPGADGSRVTWRGLLALGVSGGLIPCPSALVLLLGAIALGRLEFGLILVLAFSAGLAAVLTGIGVLLVYARRLFARFSFEARVPRFLPVASALVMALAGLGIVLSALRQMGVP